MVIGTTVENTLSYDDVVARWEQRALLAEKGLHRAALYPWEPLPPKTWRIIGTRGQ